MSDSTDPLIQCEQPDQIIGVINKMMPTLPREVGNRLNRVKLDYCLAYGVQGLYERTNNRTVSQVLAEYIEPDDIRVIAAGDQDGVTYMLYAPTSPKKNL